MSENNNDMKDIDIENVNANEAPAPEKSKNPFVKTVLSVFSTAWRWTKRMFLGASKELSMDDALAVEKLESPSKLAIKTFFRRKLAVTALVVLISLFLFVFIGPLFIPMDINYTDTLQGNIAPNYSMMKVPRKLKNDIRDINGFSNFTVGVSNDNNLYVWGYTKDALTGDDFSKVPETVEDGKVYMAAAGSNHAIVLTTDGKIIGWGSNNKGQYAPVEDDLGVIEIPDELYNTNLDITKATQLVAGYQVSGIVYDGKLYLWGNEKALENMTKIVEEANQYCIDNQTNVAKVVLSNGNAIVLYENGKISTGGALPAVASAKSMKTRSAVYNLLGYLDAQQIVDIAASNTCYAFLTADGDVLITGAIDYGEDNFADIPADQKVVSIVAGTRHFVALTDGGFAYAWGHNDYGQTKINGKRANNIFAGAKQTYLVDEDDDLTARAGLKGYLFGTDKEGRCTFTRIVHGGKMTMTVGAVAVIVSSIIAIIIGCLSGYFGGWVDMLLMRITEIFSSIPFLPFAMMLSYIIRNYPIGEKMRIFIIMMILGLLSWTGLARMIRGQVLAEREKEFVTAAKSMGVREKRIAFKHILPNIISVILVSMTLDFAGCLLTESSLSYLGFGVQLPQPTWGNMLNGANNSIVIQSYWWQWVFPSLFLSIATISINIIGDTLRDVLDPKSSQEK